MLAVRAFRIDLTTTRDVYLDGESFAVNISTIDAQGEPTGQKVSVAVLKRVERNGQISEREASKQDVTTDKKTGKGMAQVKVDDEDGGAYVIRAAGTDRFGNPILAERMLMAGTSRVIVSAKSVRDLYVSQIQCDPAKIDVVYNAVDWKSAQRTRSRGEMRAELGIAPNAKVAGVIARLTEQKGHRYLFKAMETPELPDLHLIVVGDGDLRDALHAETKALNIASRVHFLGARRDLGDLLGAMDVFVMPSLWEGLPLSMILAMGAGLPVVATEVAGIPEVVENRKTGWLVPAGSVIGLSTALAEVFADSARASSVGEAARQFVLPRFGVDSYVSSVAGLYDRLLAA